MQLRVEVVALGSVAFQTEAVLQRFFQLLRDCRKGAVFQIPCGAGTVDIVEDGQQRLLYVQLSSSLVRGNISLRPADVRLVFVVQVVQVGLCPGQIIA